MHLTQFSDFSLRVLLFLAVQPEKIATIDQISTRFKIPRNHLVKVVNRLAQKGLITSFRGKNGGIQLARDPKTYRIGDLIRDSEPHMNLVECFDHKENTCPIAGYCELEVMLYEARQAFYDTLNKYSLADFLGTKAAEMRLKILKFE